MDVLFGTDLLIRRECDDDVSGSFRDLERGLQDAGHQILAHPASIQCLCDEMDTQAQAASQFDTYPRLQDPPSPNEEALDFETGRPPTDDRLEQVGTHLLAAVSEGAVDFLITQDRDIHRKALELGLEDRVFNVDDSREHFLEDRPAIHGPAAIQQTTLGELDLADPIFDSLKADYPGFVSWAHSHETRPAWVNYTEDGSLGALLVIKRKETEAIGADPPLGRESRVKISTLKVGPQRHGSKVGELFISIAVREAINSTLDKIYLTHYETSEDYLVDLIEQYGFNRVSEKTDGEAIFQKRLTPPENADPSPLELAQQYYPSFYDGPEVDKFLIPVRPRFHNKLFTAYPERTPPPEEQQGRFRSEGNAIKKAYLSNSNTRKIDAGDVLLFYRSIDHRQVTSLGVCEAVHYGLTDTDAVSRIVGKRSVFSEDEIEEYTDKETTVLRFLWHFDLETPLSYDELLDAEVLNGPPRAMQEIDEQAYRHVRTYGGIDGRFARH